MDFIQRYTNTHCAAIYRQRKLSKCINWIYPLQLLYFRWQCDPYTRCICSPRLNETQTANKKKRHSLQLEWKPANVLRSSFLVWIPLLCIHNRNQSELAKCALLHSMCFMHWNYNFCCVCTNSESWIRCRTTKDSNSNCCGETITFNLILLHVSRFNEWFSILMNTHINRLFFHDFLVWKKGG